MRDFVEAPSLGRIMKKLRKKDRPRYEQVMSKINEILTCDDVEAYKNLRYGMKDRKRVHIGSFVLVFSYDKEHDFVTLLYYDHHDNIYKR